MDRNLKNITISVLDSLDKLQRTHSGRILKRKYFFMRNKYFLIICLQAVQPPGYTCFYCNSEPPGGTIIKYFHTLITITFSHKGPFNKLAIRLLTNRQLAGMMPVISR